MVGFLSEKGYNFKLTGSQEGGAKLDQLFGDTPIYILKWYYDYMSININV